jgi:hypothetical protein
LPRIVIWPFSRRRRRPAADLDPALLRQAGAGLPWLRTIDPSRRQRLHALAGEFLAEKTITPVHGLRLNTVQRLRLALLCCLPLLEFGGAGLQGWHELVVYPGAFRTRRSHVDANGILHEGEQILIGEAWMQGPLILSWADVQADIAAPDEGYCVVVHEMAHKLDALDGVMDGTPPLPRNWQRQWAQDFQRAYDALCLQVDAGHSTAIDPYAAEAPEEFFAVCSEYHFSDPQTLRAAMPAVADHLHRFYGPPLLTV